MTNGLFDTVLSGPASAPYKVGWAILGVGFAVSIAFENLKTASGTKPDFGPVILRAVLAAMGLSLFTFINKAMWVGCQSLAAGIYPDTKMQALAGLLKQVATRFQDYDFSILSMGHAMKDGAVMFFAIGAWLLALLGHSQLEQMQQVIYNVWFTLGPIMLGLSAFGLPSGRIWLIGLTELCAWSVTQAVVYVSIEGSLYRYLQVAKTAPLLDLQFMDVIDQLVFLGSMPILVPVVTGLALGVSALGPLTSAAGQAISSAVTSAAASLIGSSIGTKSNVGDAKPQAAASNIGRSKDV